MGQSREKGPIQIKDYRSGRPPLTNGKCPTLSIYSRSVFLVTCSSFSFFLLAVPTLFVNILFILLTGKSTLFKVANLPEYAKKISEHRIIITRKY